jgi:hypothetical protein
MLRIPIHSVANAGSYDDDDNYYLMYDHEADEYYVEHQWHHWRPNGVDKGTSKLSMEQLKRDSSSAHEKALAEIERQKNYATSY